MEAMAKDETSPRGRAKEMLMQFMGIYDGSGDGTAPRQVLLEVCRRVLQQESPDCPAENWEEVMGHEVDRFSTPCRQRVRYREFLDWLFCSGAVSESSSAGLLKVLERTRARHEEQVQARREISQSASSKIGDLLEPQCPAQSRQESWSIRSWLHGKASEVVAQALAAPVAEDPDMEFTFVQVLGQLGSDQPGQAENIVLALLRDGAVLRKLTSLVVDLAKTLSEAKASTGHEMNMKFASEAGSFVFTYGDESDFHSGLEDLIGDPNPRVFQTMKREHTREKDSQIKWTTGNYGVTTTPEIEWHFVAGDSGWKPKFVTGEWSWPAETKDTQHSRTWKGLCEFQGVFDEINARLEAKSEKPLDSSEWIAGRLYTGPMFEKYNAVNRGGSIKENKQNRDAIGKFERLCAGNRYCTTIHACSSALIKLSKLEKAETLYRGSQNGVLPPCFWKVNEAGVKGGVEFGFLSTTKKLDVAMQYVAGGRATAATIFEIKTGMIDRGADLSPFSQYPHEEEICFPPLAGLEAVGSRTEGNVLYIQIRLNINLKALTIDQVIGKRKKVVTDICQNLVGEVRASMGHHYWQLVADAPSHSELIRKVVRKEAGLRLAAITHGKDPEHFNNDQELISSIRTALKIAESIRWLKSDVLLDAARVLTDVSQGGSPEIKKALTYLGETPIDSDLRVAAAAAERRADLNSGIEHRELDPIALKHEDTVRLGLTLGSNTNHILTKLGLIEVGGVIHVKEPHPLFEAGSIQQGYSLVAVNGHRDCRALVQQLVNVTGATLTFQRPLTEKELNDSILGMLQQAKDASSVDRQKLDVARALALNHHRCDLEFWNKGLDANAGVALAGALETNQNIEHACLTANKLGDETAKAMKDVLLVNTTLKSLYIDDNNLGPAGGRDIAEALVTNDTLHTLRIKKNRIEEDGGTALAEMLLRNKSVLTLNTESNAMGPGVGKAFGKALSCNQNLQRLHIDNNQLGPEGAEEIAKALETNHALSDLWLLSNDIGERGGKALARALRANRALKSLGVNGNGIGPEAGVEIAEALEVNACLESLHIKDNKLGARGGEAFAKALRSNGALHTLALCKNNLQASAAVAIGRSLEEANQSLMELKMGKNAIGDAGAKAVAACLVKEGSTLQVLAISSNGIGPSGGESLGKALESSRSIKTLKVEGNDLGEVGGRAIVGGLRLNTSLEVLGMTVGDAASPGDAVPLADVEAARKENDGSQLQTLYYQLPGTTKDQCLRF